MALTAECDAIGCHWESGERETYDLAILDAERHFEESGPENPSFCVWFLGKRRHRVFRIKGPSSRGLLLEFGG